MSAARRMAAEAERSSSSAAGVDGQRQDGGSAVAGRDTDGAGDGAV